VPLRLVADDDGLSMSGYVHKLETNAIADGLAKLGRPKV
jgi:hypothetical protein